MKMSLINTSNLTNVTDSCTCSSVLGQVPLNKRYCRNKTWGWRPEINTRKGKEPECCSLRATEVSAFIPRQSGAFGLFLTSQSSLLRSETAYELLPRVRLRGLGVMASLILQMSSDQAQSASHPTEQSPAVCPWLLCHPLINGNVVWSVGARSERQWQPGF